jgi:hypothetical protein
MATTGGLTCVRDEKLSLSLYLSFSLSLSPRGGDRALCLPTFSHFLIVNKTSLSLLSLSSLSLSHPPSLSRRVGVEYSPSMLEPVRPEAVSPDRVLCLTTFSHFLIVNKTSLSLSHSFSLSHVPRGAPSRRSGYRTGRCMSEPPCARQACHLAKRRVGV